MFYDEFKIYYRIVHLISETSKIEENTREMELELRRNDKMSGCKQKWRINVFLWTANRVNRNYMKNNIFNRISLTFLTCKNMDINYMKNNIFNKNRINSFDMQKCGPHIAKYIL
jgi:hypothetical protein